jgi:CBS domain-containing protein
MRISEYMTTNPHSVQASDNVQHVAGVMAKQNIGAVLVKDGEQLVGIVTDRDLVVRSIAAGADPSAAAVREAMTAAPLSVTGDTSVDDALRLMVERGVGRLCVVEGGKAVGIVSFGDMSALARMLADGLARTQPAAATR